MDDRLFLDRLFRTHVDTVFGFVLARCGARSVAEEVTSEVFAEASSVVARGKQLDMTAAWLLHVARLRLIDHWRRQERHRRRIERLRSLADQSRHFEGSEPDPAVDHALAQLPERQRAALVLRYLDDYSVGQVAAALDLSYQATESLLARARRGLVAALEGIPS